ncbi:FAD-binding protein, partial [candidate division KSB1 bacterium]|nr:FAD-binding protein [candidate division KSB1 bacterium]
MSFDQMTISGNLYEDPKILERFSSDASSYRVLPTLVAEPATEDDVLAIVNTARERGLPVTCRAGGSGLSGAGVGSGIILNFKKLYNSVLKVGEETVVQPGAILDAFLKQMSRLNLMLPAVPSSSALCALGGNIGTRSTGPRTARWGTIDDFVTSLKFITARGEIVDTGESLPTYLKEGLLDIR